MKTPNEFLLASGSPRRLKLLTDAGWRFSVQPPNVEEIETGLPPAELVYENASRKAKAVSAKQPKALVLGSDTTVAIDEEILNKPTSMPEAKEMLRHLSGRAHEVHTAVKILYTEGSVDLDLSISNRVQFKKLDEAVINEYLDQVYTLDKAGGYAIQGLAARFIRDIAGSYSNVVGFSLYDVAAMLDAAGLHHGFCFADEPFTGETQATRLSSKERS